MTTSANAQLAPAQPNNRDSDAAISLTANNEGPSIGNGDGRRDSENDVEIDGEGERELSSKKQRLETRSPLIVVDDDPLPGEGILHATEEREIKQQQKQKQRAAQPTPLNNSHKNPPQQQQRKKRKICERCHRPVPQTCLCESLPATPLRLTTTEVVVLQHPLELKNHKAASHRSLPLLELCLDSSSLVLCTGRRFGEESLGTEIRSKLWGETTATNTTAASSSYYLPVLVFPRIKVEDSAATTTSKQAEARSRNNNDSNTESPQEYREDESTVLSLRALMERWKRETRSNHPTENDSIRPAETATSVDKSEEQLHNNNKNKKILLLVLDATWKHAREMHIANIKAHQYPPHMLRLALEPEDFAGGGFVPGRFRLRGKASKTGYRQQQSNGTRKLKLNQKQRIIKKNETEHRQPPPPPREEDDSSITTNAAQIDETWMSTAECIAWILSNLEGGRTTKDANECGKTNRSPKDSGDASVESSSSSSSSQSPSPSSLYEILMKPLDAMVAKWNSYRTDTNNKNKSHITSCSGGKRDRHEPRNPAVGSNRESAKKCHDELSRSKAKEEIEAAA